MPIAHEMKHYLLYRVSTDRERVVPCDQGLVSLLAGNHGATDNLKDNLHGWKGRGFGEEDMESTYKRQPESPQSALDSRC